MEGREIHGPTEEEVDRRMREEGLEPRRESAPQDEPAGAAPRPGFAPPVELGSDGLGRTPHEREETRDA